MEGMCLVQGDHLPVFYPGYPWPTVVADTCPRHEETKYLPLSAGRSLELGSGLLHRKKMKYPCSTWLHCS
jgi:hypothetical protein